jgi:hypothetical protein
MEGRGGGEAQGVADPEKNKTFTLEKSCPKIGLLLHFKNLTK